MMPLTKKERLLNVLYRRPVDRPPVICMGGMMNAAIVEIMKKTGHTLPQAHFESMRMFGLARAVQEATGFENIGVPFCMTIEAEAFGSKIDPGTLECEPKIVSEVYTSVTEFQELDVVKVLQKGRFPVIRDAVALISEEIPDVPVIGSITGPISTAASVIEPMTFMKELRKNPAGCHRVLKHVTDFLSGYAETLVRAGAAVIAIRDPTATGEILGPRLFEEYAIPYINIIVEAVHKAGAPVITHICGKMKTCRHLLPLLKSDAISTDATINLKRLKASFPELITMGNVSTYLLEFGTAERVARLTGTLVKNGIDIIAPACGLSTSTSLVNIRALTDTVTGGQL